MKISKEFKQRCKEIAQQTDNNDHTGAKISIAKLFQYRDFTQIFQCIEALHQIEGSMPTELLEYRKRKGLEMMQRIKDFHGIEIYNEINKSL